MHNYSRCFLALYSCLFLFLISMLSAGNINANDDSVNFTIFFSGNVTGELDVCG